MSENLAESDFPEALRPPLEMRAPNERITLYAGEVEVEIAAVIRTVDAVIGVDWLPRPAILCRFHSAVNPFAGSADNLNKEVRLRISSMNVETTAMPHSMQSAGREVDVCLFLNRVVQSGESEKLKCVRFHLLNCRDFSDQPLRFGAEDSAFTASGRFQIEFEEWKITLDQTESSDKLTEFMKRAGGRAITHVGQIERVDGNQFSIADAEGMFLVLENFLGFVTGRWTPIVFPFGFDGDGHCIWQHWVAADVESWSSCQNWSSDLPPGNVKLLFPGFAKRMRDAQWSEPLELAIAWYIQCKAGSSETAMILGQSALELLSWVVFVENGEVILGQSGFENLWASDRIRLLLDRMGLSPQIPDRLKQLGDFHFNNKKFADGPHAITELRNGITHPKKSKREQMNQASPGLHRQASCLGTFYLEAVLLGLFGYWGPVAAWVTHGAIFVRQ